MNEWRARNAQTAGGKNEHARVGSEGQVRTMRVVPSQRARATRSTQRASGEPRTCPSPARVRIVPGTAPSGHENGGTTWRSRRAGSRQDRAVGPRIAASQPRFALETARCFRVKGRTCVVVSRDAMWRPRSTGQDRETDAKVKKKGRNENFGKSKSTRMGMYCSRRTRGPPRRRTRYGGRRGKGDLVRVRPVRRGRPGAPRARGGVLTGCTGKHHEPRGFVSFVVSMFRRRHATTQKPSRSSWTGTGGRQYISQTGFVLKETLMDTRSRIVLHALQIIPCTDANGAQQYSKRHHHLPQSNVDHRRTHRSLLFFFNIQSGDPRRLARLRGPVPVHELPRSQVLVFTNPGARFPRSELVSRVTRNRRRGVAPNNDGVRGRRRGEHQVRVCLLSQIQRLCSHTPD